MRISQSTYEAAMLAAGCTVEAVDRVVRGELRHSMALVRCVFHSRLIVCGQITSRSYRLLLL